MYLDSASTTVLRAEVEALPGRYRPGRLLVRQRPRGLLRMAMRTRCAVPAKSSRRECGRRFPGNSCLPGAHDHDQRVPARPWASCGRGTGKRTKHDLSGGDLPYHGVIQIVRLDRPNNSARSHIVSVEITQLRALVERLEAVVAQESQDFLTEVRRLESVAKKIAESWSGSSIGYHSLVYYRDFNAPPAGSQFSQNWGLEKKFSGTSGDWVEYRYSEVIEYIEREVGSESIDVVGWLYMQCVEVFMDGLGEFESIVASCLEWGDDSYVEDMRNRANGLRCHTVEESIQLQLSRVKQVTQDSRAELAGTVNSPHHEVLAKVFALRSAIQAVKGLVRIASRVSGHLERVTNRRKNSTIGRRVFIGHGRSLQWRLLKDFIEDRLGLPCEEFDRVSVAGRATVDRLKEMLDNAAIAFLVMTAEDDMPDGSFRARENVVHEAGLFQGRLGFERAIVLVEEGCHEFSNIHGLGLISFPQGRLGAAFENVRRVLEREGLIGQNGSGPDVP